MMHLISGVVLLLAGAGSVAAAGNPCNADNCLRAMRANSVPGRLQEAQAFCATYTAGNGNAPLPTYAAVGCKGDASRVSSACTCISGSVTASSTTVSSTSSPASTTTSSTNLATSVSTSQTPTTSDSTNSTTTATPTRTNEPCAEVSRSQAAAGGGVATLSPRLAYECLQSIPIVKDDALKLIDTIKPYLEWQSTLEYLADPTPDYPYPPLDVLKSLGNIRSKISDGSYEGEYAFQSELFPLLNVLHRDQHFAFIPDLARIFAFETPVSLVSVSSDGKSLPVIRQTVDILNGEDNGQVCTYINGVPAAEFLENEADRLNNCQDKDANYNMMFFGRGTDNSDTMVNKNWSTFLYFGDNTTYTVAGGTIYTVPNIARVLVDFSGITDGESLYKKYCTGKTLAGKEGAAKRDITKRASREGYPEPILKTADEIFAGYFLQGDGYDTTAVISLTSFRANRAEFRAVLKEFLKRCSAAGKTKLVLDLRGNGGGIILEGYDLFQALFPDTEGDAVANVRHNPTLDAMTSYFSNNNPGNNLLRPFAWGADLDVNFEKFTSYEAKWGPIKAKGSYSDLFRWDTRDPYFGVAAVNATEQPTFLPESIVLLYDGVCGSTCTIFSQMIRLQKGVKSVVFGGRPNTDAMQGVGGVKGSNVEEFKNIYELGEYYSSRLTDQASVDALRKLDRYPINRSYYASINFRNAIEPKNYGDLTPSHFIRETSDCRLFWTPEMIRNVTPIWMAAADAGFRNATCINGGISYTGPDDASASGGSVYSEGPQVLSGNFGDNSKWQEFDKEMPLVPYHNPVLKGLPL